MSTALTLGALLLVLTSGALAYLALLQPADYRLMADADGWTEPSVTATDADGARISAEQFWIGALAAVAAVSSALMQLAAVVL